MNEEQKNTPEPKPINSREEFVGDFTSSVFNSESQRLLGAFFEIDENDEVRLKCATFDFPVNRVLESLSKLAADLQHKQNLAVHSSKGVTGKDMDALREKIREQRERRAKENSDPAQPKPGSSASSPVVKIHEPQAEGESS